MEVIDNVTKQHSDDGPAYQPSVFSPHDVGRSMIARFFDPAVCREWILEKLHPAGARCPGCATAIASYASLRSYRLGARVKCVKCGKFFTALTGTFLSGCHLSFAQVIHMSILIDAGADDAQIARQMSMSPEGVHGWRLRFRHAAALPPISGQGIKESRDGAKGGAVVANEVSS